MAFYRQLGSVPPKRHTQHRDEQGRLYYEELMGEEGFSSDSSLLYHRALPPAIVDSTPWQPPNQAIVPNHPLRHRHLRLPELFPGETPAQTDVVTGRRLVLGNDDVRISYVVARRESPLYRNAIGDELVYIESGAGTVDTVFGSLPVRRGDQVLLPRATTHRWRPADDEPLRAYVIEATGHIAPPKRYLSKYGQFLEHSPYCERDLHGPTELRLEEGTEVEVLVKHRPGREIVGTRLIYATHPFDVVGWDGCLYPYTFNIENFEPITGRVHQPPPAHQAFEGTNFVICNFVPRKVDYHPLSIPVPYYHSNVDSDEIMFYCGGNYEARKGSGIAQGSVSVHPGGYAHGPQPGAYERSIGAEFFDELAVMVDTFRPLGLGEGALACEDPNYAWTWSGRGPKAGEENQ
ncbi:homogentisate 1,2-dioxygenase [Nocardia sp. CDC159]|uniref:Homogentisate 1,2-dioxygenase n=1 Tax=Nocardia pulmonis TaxID=2951408 RepID=A0A9X2EFS2_9NOCA|nr:MULTISPECIES: homogentisate 1,2-dioxygenase domain-containing protein [Nocardia]MCM6777388.1 homogentisate 1,2-dioxygenase [Nocardia pulmonis]MCM6790273.1 homogentisate 1,2-dioxygenase [Nocardia sp. CDC159]